jgi:hypothetical protein
MLRCGSRTSASSPEHRPRPLQQPARRAPGRHPPEAGEIEELARMHAEGLREPRR